MKKQIMSVFLSAVMLMTMIPFFGIVSFAGTYGDLEYEIYDGEVIITGYVGEPTEVNIPSTIEGYPVTKIGVWAFYDCTSLTCIKISDSVTSIFDEAFWNCTSLATITIPDSVTSIGRFAFGNTAYYCDGTNWENGVIYIDEYLIGAESEISGNYTIKNGTKLIADYTFEFCDLLTSVTIPDSVTTIGYDVFEGCTSLENINVSEDNTAYSSVDGVLFNKDKTELIQYPIGNARTTYTIPDSVTSIGYDTFFNCRALESITIGNGVTSIDEGVFYGCTSLASINVAEENTVYSSVDGVLFNKDKTELIQYPIGNARTTYTIPDSVTSIGNGAFNGCTSLASITIPDSVTSIGGNAFAYCTSLASVTIPNCVTSIGWYAFNNCTSLASVTIGNGVTSIGDGAFYECTSLESITIPDSVKSIGGWAFVNTAYYNDATNWGNDVLYICNHLIEAKDTISGDCAIKDGTKTIAGGAFEDCTSLASITIPNSVTSIGVYAFFACTSLTDVYYTGTEEQWKAIEIDYYNECLTSATIHYNYGKTNNGWTLENGKWAFYENGAKLTNQWKKDSKGWCYLGADGYCVTNKWVKDSKGWCYLGADGYCVTNQWKADSKGWCYLDNNGRMVINSWVNDNGKWYFLDANGYMVSNCWKKDSKGWCYLGSSGAMLTNAWVKDSVGWCYVGADGYCVTNTWKKDSHGWCYLDENGRMATNKWIKDSVGWCYVGADGYCVTNAWKADSKGWCYLDANGRMMTNSWLQWNGNWYYLDENGYMVTGTKVINGKTYKFASNGVWIG